MIYGIGNDIIEVHRIKDAIERNGNFIYKVYTDKEIDTLYKERISDAKYQSLAGNFAAKEAVSKALGTGFRKFSAGQIEILRDELGKPYVVLYDEAKELYDALQIKNVHVTISHTAEYASAVCILEK